MRQLPFVAIYACLSFLELRSKLQVTPAWFDGTLERNHAALLAFQYANNEQSRLLQFYIPELLVRVLGVTVAHAYMIQRWAFVALAFMLFHLYLRKWFSNGLAFAAVCLLAAVLPFTFMNDLQESASFLMASSVAALWTIRDAGSWSAAAVLLLGALNNETTLALSSVYATDRFRDWRPTLVVEHGVANAGRRRPGIRLYRLDSVCHARSTAPWRSATLARQCGRDSCGPAAQSARLSQGGSISRCSSSSTCCGSLRSCGSRKSRDYVRATLVLIPALRDSASADRHHLRSAADGAAGVRGHPRGILLAVSR